jgi:hypothetical protein
MLTLHKNASDRRWRLGPISLTSGVLAVVVLSACTSAPRASAPTTPPPAAASATPPSGKDLLDASQMVDEYRDTAKRFPADLPPDVAFPESIPGTYDPAALSEPGVGESIANFYWICAWQAEFIDAWGVRDTSRQADALDALEDWKSTGFYRDHYEDPDDLWTTKMVAPARAGDPTELIEGFEAGCAHFRQANPGG